MDGVISLFGFPEDEPAPGSFHDIDGMSHCLGHSAGERLGRLAERFELVWATGWQGKANEYLPRLLGLEAPELPSLTFSTTPQVDAHWKLPAINEYAGHAPAAWIDDSLDEHCERWAREREAPTLLIHSEPATGISEEHVERLLRFADEVGGGRAEGSGTGNVDDPAG